MLANACSKVDKDQSCQQLIVKIAGHILNASKPTDQKSFAQWDRSKRCLIKLTDFKLKELLMLANACSKVEKDKDQSCQQLLVKIAAHILNASKPTDNESFTAQADRSKRCLIKLTDFKLKELPMLANACSKLAGDPNCEQLIVKIAVHILNAPKPTDNDFSAFTGVKVNVAQLSWLISQSKGGSCWLTPAAK